MQDDYLKPCDREIRNRLVRFTASIRTRQVVPDVNSPRFVEQDDYRLYDKVLRRVRVILRSNGCSIPTCTMCPLPNESLEAGFKRVDAIHYASQMRKALNETSRPDLLCVYNDGSFFSDRELPPEGRDAIYRLAVASGCRYLMVESLPHFISGAKLGHARDLLGEINLIVGIGLQSVNSIVRELCINSPVTMSRFLQANSLLREYGYGCKAYIMLKPPFLLTKEAIQDAYESVQWLHTQGASDITLCPTRIAPNTVVHDLYERGLFLPPKLATLVEILAMIQRDGMQARVSMFNVRSSDFKAKTPGGCGDCLTRMTQIIEEYNSDPASVNMASTVCRVCQQSAFEEDPEAFRHLSLRDRVAYYLRTLDTPVDDTAINPHLGSDISSKLKYEQFACEK